VLRRRHCVEPERSRLFLNVSLVKSKASLYLLWLYDPVFRPTGSNLSTVILFTNKSRFVYSQQEKSWTQGGTTGYEFLLLPTMIPWNTYPNTVAFVVKNTTDKTQINTLKHTVLVRPTNYILPSSGQSTTVFLASPVLATRTVHFNRQWV
jgi:hypothetical protein